MLSISVNNIKWRYPTVTSRREEYILNGLSLKIEEKGFVGITGVNGSGKSTFLLILKGKIPMEMGIPKDKIKDFFSGRVEIEGEVLTEISENKVTYNPKITEKVGMIGHQEPNLEKKQTVISFLKEYSNSLNEKSFSEYISKIGSADLADALNKDVFEISLWKLKALMIIELIRSGKSIILLDDPTSGLDPAGRLNFANFLTAIKQKRIATFIISSLELDFLKSVVDKLYTLENGIVRSESSIQGKEEKFIDKEIQEILSNEIDLLKSAKEMKGFKIERKEKKKEELLISIKNLSFSYDGFQNALENIDLDIYRGEFLALVGHNGSGKTTLSRILSGDISGWKGIIEVKSGLKYKGKIKKLPNLIGYSSQLTVPLDERYTVKEILNEKIKELGLPKDEELNMIERTLERVNLSGKEESRIGMLSRGESRRLALALVLIDNPEIIIIDEPTLGQDFERAREIMELLIDLNKGGVTVLVITHDMNIVAEYTRRVVVLKEGKKIFDGPPEVLFEDDNLMKDSSLLPPRTVLISKKLKENGIIDDLILSAKEWIEFFNFEKQRRSYMALKFHDLKEYARKMAKEILRKYGRPDAIIYIERGGMVIGRLLSDFLSVKQVYSIKASYYADTGEPMPFVNIGKFEYELKGNEGYVLLVDDIADTGKTIEAVLKELKGKVRKSILVATVVYKPQSVVKPDIYGFTVSNNTWIVFDYEETETLNSFMRKDNQEGIVFMKNNFGVP